MASSELRDTLETSLGASYIIDRELGGGGMSRVFVAEERALGRRVVVKVLAPELVEGISGERFAREIRLAATLQQANIVPLLSTGDVAGLPYYTMPYVDGQSLRARLEREGKLSIAESVSVMRDVARALAYAHARGVVHRDIKPENILLSGGAAVVTDFGIAKALDVAKGAARPSAELGVSDLTMLGMTIGTPAYMAPEQAAAEPVDSRADLYALGCVAYEMLTGAPLFSGRAPLLMLAAHAGEKPDAVAKRRADVPLALAQLVDKCLAKRPDDRPASADEILDALDTLAPRTESRTTTTRRYFVAGAMSFAVLAAVALAFLRPRSTPSLATGTTSQITASPEIETDVAISPDGKLVAYSADQGKGFRIFIRQLSGGRTVSVGGDSGGVQRWPRWSPDGSHIIYASEGTVYEVPALGGSPRAMLTTQNEFLRSNPTAAYSPDGTRVAYADSVGILVRSVAGGAPSRVATGFELHSPSWSPDGERMAYVSGNRSYVTILGNTSPSSIWIAAVSGGTPTRVTETLHLNVSPVWTPNGRSLLYVSSIGGTRDIWQLALNRDGTSNGAPQRISLGLEPYAISMSADGTRLAYSVLRFRANIWSAPISATTVTPSADATPVTRENQRVEGVSLSPDGKWIAYDANRRGNADVFRIPVGGGEPTQITTDPSDDFEPVWSPDGKQIVFYSTRTGSRDIYTMDADGGSLEHVTSLPGQERFPDWSSDGTRLVFASNATGAEELYTVTHSADGWSSPAQLTTTGAGYPRWSPDGKFIAAISQGRLVIVPASGGAPRILADPRATDGSALFAAWSHDPSIVYYLTIDPRRARWQFWSIAVSGGAPRLVFSLDGSRKQTGGITFATDGRRLFYTIASDESDVWTMELAPRR